MDIPHVLHQIILAIADHIAVFDGTWMRAGIEVERFEMADQQRFPFERA